MCPPPDDSSSRLTRPAALNEFSPRRTHLLLQLAHQAIAAALEQREISLTAPTAHLAEPRGAFTTLYYRGALRGCVGYVFPVTPLYRTVAESARGAAFDDSRFSPVTRDEAPELQVSLSVLSPPQPIQPEEVEIGRHGLLVKSGPVSRSVAAASAGRARMGPHHFPGTDLQESRPAVERMANRRQAGGLHRGSLWRPRVRRSRDVSLSEVIVAQLTISTYVRQDVMLSLRSICAERCAACDAPVSDARQASFGTDVPQDVLHLGVYFDP